MPKSKIEIKLPFKTPTINHLYGQHGYRKYLKKEAKELREQINELVLSHQEDVREKKLRVTIEIYENWYTLKGKVKKKDIANREKFLVDSVFNALGVDDKFIFEHIMIKKQSEDEEYAIVKIEEI